MIRRALKGWSQNLKILATSDFHGSTEAATRTALKAQKIQANCIVVGGDITHFGSVRNAEEILKPLIALGLPVLYVLGNCDPAQLADAQITGAVNLHGKCQRLDDVSFIGLGGAPASPYYSWFELSETQIMNILERSADLCPMNPWFVVVSHAPPKDTTVDLAFSRVHAGSTSLRAFVEQRKPSVVFCGHIHEARGVDRLGDTFVVNPGPVRHGKCAIVDLQDSIEIKLDSL